MSQETLPPTDSQATQPGHPRLLLHCCCAPCASYVVETLRPSFDLACCFYNPNIHPEQEHETRLADMRRLAAEFAVPLMVPTHDPEAWFQAVRGHELQPEGGSRCPICYGVRLEKTAQCAAENGFSWFTSTLSVSPHKNARAINSLGEDIACRHHLQFYCADFKKKDGFKMSLRLSKQFGLYRQDYCGCQFSRPPVSAPASRLRSAAALHDPQPAGHKPL